MTSAASSDEPGRLRRVRRIDLRGHAPLRMDNRAGVVVDGDVKAASHRDEEIVAIARHGQQHQVRTQKPPRRSTVPTEQ